MIELEAVHKEILEHYSRPVVHMRRQLQENRFGLVFGAGFSRPFKIPDWSELVEKLAKEPKVNGEHLLQLAPPRASLPYQTEMLFEHYKKKREKSSPLGGLKSRELDYEIAADWREIIRDYLYKNVDDNVDKLIEGHPYLNAYLPIIQRTQMTITYNFDDFIESALHKNNRDAESLGYESVTNPWTQFKRKNAIIYHPNGIVPRSPLETPSDRFVFSEASFAEQLLGIYAGEQAGLVNYLSKNTCLIIGLSLEDDTLRSALMQAGRSSPGNYHYYVHYLDDGAILSDDDKIAITMANFKVYNLITLFLKLDEIKALGEMLCLEACDRDNLCDFAQEHGIIMKYCFYLTGAIGTGKTTSINHFRNLVVLDEWMEPALSILAKDWKQLTTPEQEKVDDWIAKQFSLKNRKLKNEREGIFMLDRGPLDPFAFTPIGKESEKAGKLLDKICPNGAWEVESGKVILIKNDSRELALRNIIIQRKGYTEEKLLEMETRLEDAYGDVGVFKLDARNLNPEDVVRQIAQIVHLDAYAPACNLHKRLEEIKKQEPDTSPSK